MGEPQEENDLFFVCSLIEYIARKTKNTKKYIVEKLEEENIKKIYELAEVYHSENIEKISDEFIEKCDINEGTYNILENCKYRIPTFWEIGKVYQRLILRIDNNKDKYVKNIIEVLSSWIIEKIDDYNSSMFYENPDYIYECYVEGKIL